METKIKYLLILLILLPFIGFNQVGINTTTPNAVLDIQSSNQATPASTDGILIPKIDEYPTVNPTVNQDGMLVYATGNGSVIKGFYYWDNTTTSWVSFTGAIIEKIDDLIDGKSDNDGSDNGSSIFLGINAGANDDETNNRNVGIGINALTENTSGIGNSAYGSQSLYSNTSGGNNSAFGRNTLILNTTGSYNSVIGSIALYNNTTGIRNSVFGSGALRHNIDGNDNVAVGSNSGASTNGNRNVFLGYNTGASGADTKDGSVFIGSEAGYIEGNSNRLYIENTSSSSPLIYGEFDNDLLRVNGDFEVEKSTDASITVKTPFGDKSSLKLFESGGADYGFEFQYDGSPDKLYLWSRTFAGNEGIRMTWLKDGRVGINDTAPNALLDIEATNSATPRNTDGILIPRINTFPSANPTVAQNGMLIYLNSDGNFYHWHNATTSWQKLGGVDRIDDLIDGKSDNVTSLFMGENAGLSNTSGTTNTSVGYQSLYSNTAGNSNTAIGYQSMFSNITGIGNTSVGDLSLFSNTTGGSNTAIGWSSLTSNATGNSNTAVGYQSLWLNTTGNENTALGRRSLRSNTTGGRNTAIGYTSLSSNTIGEFNTAMGWSSLNSNSIGISNTAVGYQSLSSNTTGNENTALGRGSLLFNTTGNGNTALGRSSLRSNTIGVMNVAIGFSGLSSNTRGGQNVAIGNESLLSNTFGNYNTAIGFQSLFSNISGHTNAAVGRSSLYNNTTGFRNTASGRRSLFSNTTGSRNTAFGSDALYEITTGNNNSALGYNAGPVISSLTNTTAIGYNAVPLSSNWVRIGNAAVSIIGGATTWSVFSDKRLKTNIKEDIAGLAFIKKLRPVSYNLDMDAIARFEKTPDSLRLRDAELLKAQEVQTGFIAQEVEAAANEVGFNFHGIVKPYDSNGTYALRYAEFVVPLVKAMQEQQDIIKSQQKDIDTLKRQLEEIKALLRQD